MPSGNIACSRCGRELWHTGDYSWMGTICTNCQMVFCEDCQAADGPTTPCRNCGGNIRIAGVDNIPSQQQILSKEKPPFSPESLPKKREPFQKRVESGQPISKKWWRLGNSSENVDKQILSSLLIELLSNDNSRMFAAGQRIIDIGNPAMVVCRAFIGSNPDDDFGCSIIADLLGKVDSPEAIELLIRLVENSARPVRITAQRSLCQISDKKAEEALKKMLVHPISDVRGNARTALSRRRLINDENKIK